MTKRFPLSLESRKRRNQETVRKWASIWAMMFNATIVKHLHHFWQDETSPFPFNDLLKLGLGFEYVLPSKRPSCVSEVNDKTPEITWKGVKGK